MTGVSPERALLLSYAPVHARPGMAALLALDDVLAKVLQTTTEPTLGQIRLTWWFDALQRLDVAPAPAEPVLTGLADHVLPHGIKGSELAPLVEGWEELLGETIDSDALGRFAEARGARLFALIARIAGSSADPVAMAGSGWALADLSRHLSDVPAAERAVALAGPLLDAALAARWTRSGRALGAMAHLARMQVEDVAGKAKHPAARVGRLLWHRFTGR